MAPDLARPSCPLLTVSSELGLRGQHSSTTDAVLETRLKQVESVLKSENSNEQSLVLMSNLVGALVLVRSVENPEPATRIMKVVRGALKDKVSDEEKASQ